MSDSNYHDLPGRPWRLTILALCLGLATFLAGAPGRAAKPKSKKPPVANRPVVGKGVTAKGTILRRTRPDKPWKIVARKGNLYSDDLIVGLPGAELDSSNGAVRLVLLADLDRNSPYPIREAAVRLHSSRQFDLDLTLDRGRIDLDNRKKKGPATVRVRVRQATWELTLAEPGASIALELYGRWPAGTRFTKKPGPKDVPTANLVFLVLKGEVALKHGGFEHALTAPPGPALIEWDSVNGQDQTPQALKELPSWAVSGSKETPRAKMVKATVARFRKALATKSVDAAVDEFLQSDDPMDRRLAVFVMGALDNLKGLGQALRQAKHIDVWENGVLSLRHWIGRAPGQDQILYNGLLRSGLFEPVHAETVVQLLHSFDETDLAMPETYQTLIDYLDHDKLAIRGLAYWHLSRLVPEGKKFGYLPNDPREKREAAIKQWQKLIPKGQLPPRPKTKKSK